MRVLCLCVHSVVEGRVQLYKCFLSVLPACLIAIYSAHPADMKSPPHTHTHSCPPRAFIPGLCKIFMDEEAPDGVLEVTARALTYYLDVSADCTRRITAVDGALKAIITRMQVADMSIRSSKDLAEQCVKVGQQLMQCLYGS